MPKFGDYETIDEPLRVTEAAAHVSTIWKARNTVAQDGEFYVVKQFSLRPPEAGAPSLAPEPTGEDRLKDFLEGVKQLQEAQSKAGHFLAPIYASGTADGGAWYATDFCPRRSLREFINLQGGVENRALERVVYGVVSGCLALQSATGRSHGNLKASNVLLAGRPQHLRKTPLHLTDPLPVHAAGMVALRPTPTGERPDQIRVQTEQGDIRGIGELILQLVEGRIINSAYDYNYPVASSPAWENLGKDAGLWLQRCNQLLNPQLKPSLINLGTLEDEFRPARFQSGLRVVAGCAGAAVLAAGIWYGVDKYLRSSPDRAAEAARINSREDWGRLIAASHEAQARGDWRVVRDMLSQAMRKAQELNDANLKQQTTRELAFAQSMSDALDALRAGKTEAATQLMQTIAQQRPGDPAAATLKSQIDAAVDEATKLKEFQQLMQVAQRAETDEQWPRAVDVLKQALLRASTLKDATYRQPVTTELSYAEKMDTAQRLLDDKAHPQLFLAIANAMDALALKPASTNAAGRLIARAQQRIRGDLTQSTAQARTSATTQMRPPDRTVAQASTNLDPAKVALEQSYQTALKAAQAAFNQGNYPEAVKQADVALTAKSKDAAASRIKTDAQVAQRYQTALKAAQAALDREDYTEAIKQSDAALAIVSTDAQARRIKATAETERSYHAAFDAGVAAFAQGDYPQAIKQADLALSNRPQDAQASRLKSEAQAEQSYQTAMQAGFAAFTKGDYSEALKQADAALKVKNKDKQAGKFKADVQAEQGFQTAMKAANAAFTRGDYSQSIEQAQAAMQLKKNAPGPAEIIDAAQRRLAKVEQDKQDQQEYLDGLNAGRAALQRREYAQAITQADAALRLRPNEPEATRLKLTAQQEQSYDGATTAFKQGDYLAALSQCQSYQGTERFDRLTQQINQEQSQLQTQQKALSEGNYAAILGVTLPGKPSFDKVKTAATTENQALQQARQKLAAGDYGFIEPIEQQSYQAKPPFATLLDAARKERDALKYLQQLKASKQDQVLVAELAKLPQDLRAKQPFLQLTAQPQTTTPPPQTRRPEASPAVANSDRLLAYWEVYFGVKPRPAGSDVRPVRDPTKDSTFSLEQFDKVEADYNAVGALDAERKHRLNVLRWRVSGGTRGEAP
jgi:hypothetical protein